MSPVKPESPISRLNPISDAEAGRAASPQTMADLAAEIVRTPVPARAGRRRRAWGSAHHMRRPVLALGLAAGGLTVLVLVTSGVLSGQGPTEAQPAAAAVLRGAAAALQVRGSIVIESDNDVQNTDLRLVKFAPGYKHRKGIQTVRWSNHEITETPVGSGAQNEINLGGPSVTNGVQIGEVNGNNELYDPANNTVYISSEYGADITTGARPGTYVLKLPKLADAPPGTGAAEYNAHLPLPFPITAAQAQALRDGTAAPELLIRATGPYRVKITPAFRTPVATSAIQAQLKAGKLRVDGPTTVDGRKAIKLTSIHGPYGYEYYVAPGTYYPIKQVFRSRAVTVTTIYSEYRVLPETPANQLLLSLAARHPGARIDRDQADYQAAQARLITGS
jgi:hypothetical protein